MPSRKPTLDFAAVTAAALELPGVALSTSYRTPSLKVKGKVMARLRTEADGALMLRCDLLDRAMLMQADPETFFITEHYRDYPAILVNLPTLRRAALPQLLEAAWQLVATPTLKRELAARRAAAEGKSPPR